MLSAVLILLAVVSVSLNLWQWMLGRQFPLHGGAVEPAFLPPVSVLKPLKGCDSETEACLESWFRQDYQGEYELLFGAFLEEDPVCEVVRRLIKRYPKRLAKLIVGERVLGPNGKVSSLCHLFREARHEHLVLSDADVFVQPGFLSGVVVPLADPSVGLVNCLYILARPKNLAMRLQAVGMNADFWSQVLLGVRLWQMDFALGAVMATRKPDLLAAGGFEGLLEYLADDYQLGQRMARTRRKVVLSSHPVECRSGELSTRAVWNQQLRWERTIRFCEPTRYFFSILGNATLWLSLAGLLGGNVGVWILSIGLPLRMLAAISNYARLAGTLDWRVGCLAPVKDLAHAALWALAFAGNEVSWREEHFRVLKGGKLTRRA